VTGLLPDRPLKEKAAPPQRSAAFLKSRKNQPDSEADRVSSFSLATFSPGAQAGLSPFAWSEISPPLVLPADSYGYGAGRAVRGDSTRPSLSWAKVNWRIPESSAAKSPSLDNDGNFASASHECLSESRKGESKSGFTGESRKAKKFTEEEVREFEKDAEDDVNRRDVAHRSIDQRYADRDFICSLIKDVYPLEYEKLRRCGEHLVIKRRRYCGRFEGWGLIHGCGLRICPFCSRARANAKFRDIWPVVWAYAQRHPGLLPCAVVLTFKDNTPEWAELTQRQKIKRTQQALGKLLRRLEFKEHITAGVWSIENTKNASGNDHMHCHLVVFRDASWANACIAALWSEVTDGFGGFTYIKAQDDLRSSLQHTLKYALKPASVKGWTAEDARQFMDCKGLRLTTRFGGLYGFKLTESEEERFAALEAEHDAVDPICPSCGRVEEGVLDTLCVGRFAVREELGDRHGDWGILNLIRSREARAP